MTAKEKTRYASEVMNSLNAALNKLSEIDEDEMKQAGMKEDINEYVTEAYSQIEEAISGLIVEINEGFEDDIEEEDNSNEEENEEDNEVDVGNGGA